MHPPDAAAVRLARAVVHGVTEVSEGAEVAEVFTEASVQGCPAGVRDSRNAPAARSLPRR
ncbi:hypothetical protein STXM2123_3774 [Streptomyces sp. F-3]|nr:hypothetical protein STXM2123_3774 [Streptomyces sp. F-3]